MPAVMPFPYAALPAFSREEIAAASRLREATAGLVRPEAVAAALGNLCGEPASIVVRRTRTFEAGRVPAHAVGVVLAPADAPGLSRAVLVEVEPALATALVARALRQRTPRVTDASHGVSPEVAGALAALLHAVSRRAHADAPLRVVAAGPAPSLARDLAATGLSIVTAWLTVVLGADAFDARVSVPIEELPLRGASRAMSRDALVAMGDAPIALPLVLSTCRAERADVSCLRVGDVFVFPRSQLRDEGGRLSGPVAVVAPSVERGLTGDLADNDRLVLRTELATHSWDRPTENPSMTAAPNTTLEVLEDAPVVVRVELGVVEMKAREWAALSPGDVVPLGRKLGDPAILRVGGVEIARGELVQVDGEYGVRILGRGPLT